MGPQDAAALFYLTGCMLNDLWLWFGDCLTLVALQSFNACFGVCTVLLSFYYLEAADHMFTQNKSTNSTNTKHVLH